MIRVLLADAHEIVRMGFRYALQTSGQMTVVSEATSGCEALAAAAETEPDVLLADLFLPDEGGIEFIRKLNRVKPARCILTGTRWEGAMATRALDVGALGVLSHKAGPDDVVKAIRSVALGQPFLSFDLLQEVAYQRAGGIINPISRLSDREFEIFQLLSVGRSVDEIAGKLCLRARSVANYKAQIKRKLGVATTAGLAHLAIDQGVVSVNSGARFDASK